jgi:hypothetical protein
LFALFGFELLLFATGTDIYSDSATNTLNGGIPMAGENASSNEAKTVQIDEGGKTSDRSSIGFPYNNLNDAIDVARAIHSNGDGDDAQLSAWLDMSAKSSGYRVQLSAARMFGLVETANGRHKLTPLGKMAMDPQREREARVKAFMSVPLYSRLYEEHKGGVIPPAAALERDMVRIGVIETQKSRARQVFEKSAEQANFFEHGRNRLVMPGFATRDEPEERPDDSGKDEQQDKGKGSSSGGPPNDLDLDPLLIELLKKIPPTKDGWPAPQRLRWFKTFAMNVSQIYDEDDAPVELEIKLDQTAGL